jgi:hypothetical protein
MLLLKECSIASSLRASFFGVFLDGVLLVMRPSETASQDALAQQQSRRMEEIRYSPSKEVAAFLGVFGLVGLLRVETTLS